MKAELIKTFNFDAAHALASLPAGHKCRNMHGHSYRVDIHVTGEVDPDVGWVIDFGEIKKLVKPILDDLDHHCLNEVEGLENSTSENIAGYLWDRLIVDLPTLSAITVWESDTSRVVYRGE
ncbi:MAG: 6-carboxytetrahydropterin synthase QueD [Phycisphaerae bacterium]